MNIVQRVNMMSDLQACTGKKHPRLQDTFTWFYNEFVARVPTVKGQAVGMVNRRQRIDRAGYFVERPTKFDLILNLRTARPIGLSLPQPILLRADSTIE